MYFPIKLSRVISELDCNNAKWTVFPYDYTEACLDMLINRIRLCRRDELPKDLSIPAMFKERDENGKII